MIMDLLSRRMTATAELKAVVNTFDPATGKNTQSNSWGSEIKCIFYKAGSAKSFVSELIREQTSAVALFKPNVTITGDRLRINGTLEYSIIDVDDIAGQGQVKVVSLGKIT